jgi:hypothetical protein
MRKLLLLLCLWAVAPFAHASYILLPMDNAQANHLKAYGMTYWILKQGVEADWLLNYRGGSFMFKYDTKFEQECKIRGVSYQVISNAQSAAILEEIASPDANMDAMRLDKPPKVAVYSPKSKQPWDDAVTLVLSYAEIPYDIIFDDEVMRNDLPKYDWLHLHHEDFTGQYGRFYQGYSSYAWYRENQRKSEELARSLGFNKVSTSKLAVVKKIRDFVGGGGFMFAMCSATDTYDIALAADGLDICADIYDGDPADASAQNKLNFGNCFAFKNFTLVRNPLEYEFSSIDMTYDRQVATDRDYFTLFDFSAKWDPVPTMLTQNHTKTVKGFMGQTTAFRKSQMKSNVLILGENKAVNEARYIHGIFGKGFWTFYGGHDPEDYQHRVNDPETDLNLHPNSPGYRLILNNILFPAAKKKERKT